MRTPRITSTIRTKSRKCVSMRMKTNRQQKACHQCQASNAWTESSICLPVQGKLKQLRRGIVLVVLPIRKRYPRRKRLKEEIQPLSTCSTFYPKSRREMSCGGSRTIWENTLRSKSIYWFLKIMASTPCLHPAKDYSTYKSSCLWSTICQTKSLGKLKRKRKNSWKKRRKKTPSH